MGTHGGSGSSAGEPEQTVSILDGQRSLWPERLCCQALLSGEFLSLKWIFSVDNLMTRTLVSSQNEVPEGMRSSPHHKVSPSGSLRQNKEEGVQTSWWCQPLRWDVSEEITTRLLRGSYKKKKNLMFEPILEDLYQGDFNLYDFHIIHYTSRLSLLLLKLD